MSTTQTVQYNNDMWAELLPGNLNTLTDIPAAVIHNADGSVTLCKEVVSELYHDRRVPADIHRLFEPMEDEAGDL